MTTTRKVKILVLASIVLNVLSFSNIVNSWFKVAITDFKNRDKFSTQQLFDSYGQIETRTVWFGSQNKSVQFAIVNPKTEWENQNILYISKDDSWEKIHIPKNDIYKVADICRVPHDQEHVIIEIEEIDGKKTSYGYSVFENNFKLISKE